MINCYILTSDLLLAENLGVLLNSVPHFSIIGICTSMKKEIDTILQLKPDVLFVSEDLLLIHGHDLPIDCILVRLANSSANESFISDGLKLNKSLEHHDFFSLVQRIAGQYFLRKQQVFSDFFYVQSTVKGRRNKVYFRDIRYIETMSNYSVIHCTAGDHSICHSLKELLAYLPASGFFRIHKSYIVNIDFILAIEGNRVFLNDKKELNIGRLYKAGFFNLMDNYTIMSRANSKKNSINKMLYLFIMLVQAMYLLSIFNKVLNRI